MPRPSLLVAASLLLPSLAAGQEVPVASLELRCRYGEALACATAGARYQLGRGVPVSLGRALDMFTRGCQGDAMVACELLGALYADGLGVGRDEARAVSLFRQACDGRHEHACGQLGLMMVGARGTAREIPGAAPFLARGCEARHYSACEVLGRMYARGIGVTADPSRGAALLQIACGGGRSAACGGDLGSITFAAPPPVTGAETFAAPPPVTGIAPVAPPPRVAPPPAPPPRPAAPPPPPPPPRVVYVERRAPVPESVGSGSSVSFLGGEHRASSFYLGGEFGVVAGDGLARPTLAGLGFRHSRGPVEFYFNAQFGGGTVANLRGQPKWTTFALGAGLGLNVLSWPRSDRERFSIINLSGGINTTFGLADMSGGDAFRLGGYVANTMFFLCWFGVRTEFVGSILGEGTWGHTLHASLFFGGRPSAQCR